MGRRHEPQAVGRRLEPQAVGREPQVVGHATGVSHRRWAAGRREPQAVGRRREPQAASRRRRFGSHCSSIRKGIVHVAQNMAVCMRDVACGVWAWRGACIMKLL